MSNGKLRVLVAEDDPIGARFAIAAVERLGHDAVRVETGREALARLKDEHFDVAMLDMGLPELAGIDVARRLRTHERAAGLNAIVIVALTAADLSEEECASAGIDAVLEKPVVVSVLAEALARCMGPRGCSST